MCRSLLVLFVYMFVGSFSSSFGAEAGDAVNEEKVGLASLKTPTLTMQNHYYITLDDGSDLSQPLVNRHGWNKRYFGGLPLSDKNVWLQIDFNIEQSAAKSHGLVVMIVASFDAYWDGKLIGSNGVIGYEKSQEQPGQIETGFQLTKEQLTKGRHTLSLRVSSHHNNTENDIATFYVFNGDYPEVVSSSKQFAMLPLAVSGALFLLSVYCFLLYFNGLKETHYILFSGLCLSLLLLFIAESWRGLWGYSYDWHIVRLEFILVMSGLVSFLMTSFFSYFFNLSNRVRAASILINILIQLLIYTLIEGFDRSSLYVVAAGTLTSIIPCSIAAYQRQQHAWLMLFGLALFAGPIVISHRFYMEQYVFLSFSVLIAFMLYSMSQTFRAKQQQLHSTQMNASRLELELVKRHLQPHFILNTLTAVEEWIEESPQQAVKFIDALADEFRMMAKISSLSLVTIQEEISMCKAHLAVMTFRTNSKIQLKTSIQKLDCTIPPGVLLTLLENAISHSGCQDTEFSLTQSVNNELMILTFSAPYIDSRQMQNSNLINLGIGSQYIEARLAESYGNDWLLTQQKEQDEWQVTLQVPAQISHQQQDKLV